MWLIYNRYVSTKVEEVSEQLRLQMASYIVQRTSQEMYSPFEKTITEVVKFFEAKNRDSFTIYQWHKLLNPTLLSTKGYSFKADNGREIHVASALESWHATNCKLLLKMKKYEEVLDAAANMVESMKKANINYHHNNEHWLVYRKAQALMAIQREEDASILLKELIQKFQHSTIFYQLMKISRSREDLEQALFFGAEGLLDKAGQYEHKLPILKEYAEILAEQSIVRESYAHYALIQKVREKNNWQLDEKIQKEMSTLQRMDNSCKSFTNKELRNLWNERLLNQYEFAHGTVKIILGNGKAGFVREEGSQEEYYFNSRNSECAIQQLQPGTAVSFRKKPSFDRAKNKASMEAIQVSLVKKIEYPKND